MQFCDAASDAHLQNIIQYVFKFIAESVEGDVEGEEEENDETTTTTPTRTKNGRFHGVRWNGATQKSKLFPRIRGNEKENLIFVRL